MSKHSLIMIHGMGEQQADWQKPAVKQLRKAWKNAGLKEAGWGTFDGFYDVSPFSYSSEFIEYWDRYRENANKLKKLNVPGKPSIIKAIVKIATSTDNLDSNAITHWSDVLLYATSSFNHKIPLQFIQYLRKLDPKHYSIIGHSLGTRIVHDALQRGFTDESDLYSQVGTPTVLLQAANVTELMSFNRNEFIKSDWAVFPTETFYEGACQHLITAHHEADLIPGADPYYIHTQNINDAYKASNYYQVKLNFVDLYPEIRFSDVWKFLSGTHSLENYLANPDVYVPFFNNTLKPHTKKNPAITPAEHKALKKEFSAYSPVGKLKDSIKIIRAEFEGLGKENVKQKVKSLNKIRDTIEVSLDLVKELKKES